MSIHSVKPDSGSKVLPGDKTGLPLEIWRIILSFLSAEDLCHSSCVCKTWNDLVLSLDSFRWRELYFECKDWKHPFWPLNTDSEPASWKQAYKEQYQSVRFWSRNAREPDTSNCLYVLKRKRERKVIQVGPGKEHTSLKSALAVANDYDRIEIFSGIYDEQFEMSSKIPFEIIGIGELGSIILVVCIEQIAVTGRISNIVFRAPWFTNFILKVRLGYLQVDNCIMEDGMIYIQNPGSCHIKFCTLRHATVIFQHLNSSIIENCEFSQTDSAAITIEGHPREDKNWTYNYMAEKVAMVTNIHRIQSNGGYETAPTSAFSTSTALTRKMLTEKSCDSKTDIFSSVNGGNRRYSMCSSMKLSGAQSDITDSCPPPGSNYGSSVHSNMFTKLKQMNAGNMPVWPSDGHFPMNGIHPSGSDSMATRDKEKSIDWSSTKSCDQSHSGSDKTENSLDNERRLSINQSTSKGVIQTNSELHISVDSLLVPSEVSTTATTSKTNLLDRHNGNTLDNSTEPTAKDNVPGPSGENNKAGPEERSRRNSASPQQQEDRRSRSRSRSNERSSRSNSPISVVSGSDFFDDDDSIDEYDSGSGNSEVRGGSSTSSSDANDLLLSDSESDFYDEEESVIMLTCPKHQQPRSISAASIGADVQSLCSQNQSEHIKIIQDIDMQKVLKEVRGCLIHRCRISQCKGAMMISLQAHAVISQCDINSVGYGLRCIQNAKVVVLKNEIHHCRTSGVFMRLAASGLIAGNDIHSNCEAGVDIRKNADPIVLSNRIHHGKRSGIVVLGSGRGQIKNNDIYQNKEAGIYILYRGNPVVSKNQIHSGRAAGVAVNEGGRGYVQDNVIRENQWGGVDIRHGGDPVITQNVICNGMSDGIVIGERGRGSIENNVITGNAGCGVWITAACQPMIHGNQINNNGDTGITFVNKTDDLHEAETMTVERSESQSQKSYEFWQFINDEQPHPRRQCTRATVEYNSIFHNLGRGVTVMFGDEVAIQCNTIHGNRGDGIHIDQSSAVLIKDNSITCNAGNGAIASSIGKVNFIGNGVFDNRDYGISVQNEAHIEENDVVGNQRNAVQLEKNSHVIVRQNRLQSLSEKALMLLAVVDGMVEQNQMYKCSSDPISAVNSKCLIRENKIIPLELKAHNSSESGINAKSCKDLVTLKDPPARPHIEAPPLIPTLPANQVTTVTRVTVPSSNSCEEGSKLCIIL